MDKLFKRVEYKRADTILFYVSFDGEVDTFEMIKCSQNEGKKIVLPRVDTKRRELLLKLVTSFDCCLEVGPYGILEPKDQECQTIDQRDIDMVVVPGVAFDKSNNRIGRGGGYFDRFLKKLPMIVPKIGIAFDFQIFDQLPQIDTHDSPVSFVLSN